jgi:hypothetical protein
MLNKSISYLGSNDCLSPAAGLGLSAVGLGLSAVGLGLRAVGIGLSALSILVGLDPYLGSCKYSFLLLQI